MLAAFNCPVQGTPTPWFNVPRARGNFINKFDSLISYLKILRYITVYNHTTARESKGSEKKKKTQTLTVS